MFKKSDKVLFVGQLSSLALVFAFAGESFGQGYCRPVCKPVCKPLKRNFVPATFMPSPPVTMVQPSLAEAMGARVFGKFYIEDTEKPRRVVDHDLPEKPVQEQSEQRLVPDYKEPVFISPN